MTDFTGGTWRSLVDGAEVSAIPASGLDNFWWAPEISNISNDWADVEGLINVSPNGDPQLGDINGTQAVVYDGTGDYHQSTTAPSFGASDEWTAVVVFDRESGADRGEFLQVGDGSNGYAIGETSGGEFFVSHPGVGSTTGGSVDANPTIIVATYDGSAVVADVNKTEIINTSLGSPTAPSGATTLGARGDGSFEFSGGYGAAGHEAAAADATRRDELTDLFADEFGISV